MFDKIEKITGSGFLGAASAYATRYCLVTHLNPLEGAAFCAIGRLVTEISLPYFASFLKQLKQEIEGKRAPASSMHVLNLTSFLMVAGVTTLVCSQAGIPVTFGTALILRIGQMACMRLGQLVCTLAQRVPMPKGCCKILNHIHRESLVVAF